MSTTNWSKPPGFEEEVRRHASDEQDAEAIIRIGMLIVNFCRLNTNNRIMIINPNSIEDILHIFGWRSKLRVFM